MDDPSLMDENSDNPSSQPRFLMLAREVRDLIYKMVLTTSPPETQNEIDRTGRQRLNAVGYSILEHSAWYPMKPPPSPAKSLLVTCRQIRNEIVDLFLFEQKCRESSRYELSITIQEEISICPNWLLIPPVPSEMASVVWVDILIAGSNRYGHRRSGWRPGNGWIPSLVWGLFCILNRFLLYGPSFSVADADSVKGWAISALLEPHVRPQSHPIQEVKLLVLNVVTPTENERDGKPLLPFMAMSDGMNRLEGMTNPDTVIHRLGSYLAGVVARGKHEKWHSRLVYERMKLVRICLDGKERMFFNVEDKTNRFSPECIWKSQR